MNNKEPNTQEPFENEQHEQNTLASDTTDNDDATASDGSDGSDDERTELYSFLEESDIENVERDGSPDWGSVVSLNGGDEQ